MIQSIIEAVEVLGQHWFYLLEVFELGGLDLLSGTMQWGDDGGPLSQSWGRVGCPGIGVEDFVVHRPVYVVSNR